MPEPFPRPAAGPSFPDAPPAPVRSDDYTRPLTLVPPYPGQPVSGNWVQPFPPPRPPGPMNYVGWAPAAAVWSGPTARSALPAAPWGPPPAKPGPSGRWWAWIAGSGVAALAVAIAVIAAFVSGCVGVDGPSSRPVAAPASPSPAAAPAPPPPPAPIVIEDAQLPRMVPLEAHVAEVVGASRLEAMAKATGPGLLEDYADPAGCAGALVPATKSAYEGSGVRATYVQALHDPARNQVHRVVNTVSTFESAAQATQFATEQAVAWQGCQTVPIVLDGNEGHPSTWVVSDVAQHDGLLTGRGLPPDSAIRCQRALKANLNVVADVLVCADTVTNAAAALATEIAGHLGQAT